VNIERIEKELVRPRQFVSDLVQNFRQYWRTARNDFSQQENQGDQNSRKENQLGAVVTSIVTKKGAARLGRKLLLPGPRQLENARLRERIREELASLSIKGQTTSLMLFSPVSTVLAALYPTNHNLNTL